MLCFYCVLYVLCWCRWWRNHKARTMSLSDGILVLIRSVLHTLYFQRCCIFCLLLLLYILFSILSYVLHSLYSIFSLLFFIFLLFINNDVPYCRKITSCGLWKTVYIFYFSFYFLFYLKKRHFVMIYYILFCMQVVESWLVDKVVLPIESSVGGSIPNTNCIKKLWWWNLFRCPII